MIRNIVCPTLRAKRHDLIETKSALPQKLLKPSIIMSDSSINRVIKILDPKVRFMCLKYYQGK